MRCGVIESRAAFVCLDGNPCGGSFTLLCAPSAGGTVEKTARQPGMAASVRGCVYMPEPDYKQMYLTLFDATEKAVNLLIQAQQKCEELYISSSEPESETFELEQ